MKLFGKKIGQTEGRKIVKSSKVVKLQSNRVFYLSYICRRIIVVKAPNVDATVSVEFFSDSFTKNCIDQRYGIEVTHE